MKLDPKLPREWLLQRRQHQQANLDRRREDVVRAALADGKAGPEPTAGIGLLRALFFPNRFAWGSLAIVWLALLALHFTRPTARPAAKPTVPPEAIVALLHQFTYHDHFIDSGS